MAFVSLSLSLSSQRRSLLKCSICIGHTKPPGYLTESEILGLMEDKGVGTDASMASHINNICERNYVTVGHGRTLVRKKKETSNLC